jgi:hypothetical protein
MPDMGSGSKTNNLTFIWQRLLGRGRLTHEVVGSGPWHFGWGAWLIGGSLFALGAAAGRIAGNSGSHLVAYLAATFFGMLVGATEIVARYRDRPTAALETLPGLIYVAVNALVSLVAFWLLHTRQIDLKLSNDLGATLNEVLIAGFGSMALFRTSIFTLRVRDTDIAVGPAAVLQVILSAADRACDRLRAGPRSRLVKDIMMGVSFARAKLALPLHCLALMQNVSAEEERQLTQAIASLDAATKSDEVKAYNLGLLLMNFIGEDVLHEAINALGTAIQGPPADEPPIFTQAGQLAFSEMSALIQICIALDPIPRNPNASQVRESWLVFDVPLEHEVDKNIIVLARLRQYFGPETLSRAIALLSAGRKDVNVKPVKEPLNLQDFAAPS